MDNAGPSIYPLLIGVSDYPDLFDHEDDPAPAEHLGLRKLSSPALTVHRIHEWLERRKDFLPLPLGPCRKLVSASQAEIGVAPDLAQWTERATLENTLAAIEQWREDLARNPNSIAFFYFAGHGAKRERQDDVLLLDGFGKQSSRILRAAIDTTSLMDGMAPSKQYPNIARTQLYFFDACRVKPRLFKDYESLEATPLWDRTELNRVDDRAMLTLFTTEPGARAYGPPGDQSLFSYALIRCLDGAAAESSDAELRNWAVTAMSLTFHIQAELDDVSKEVQSVQFGKSPSRDFLLNRLENPPSVDVRLNLEPEAVRACARVKVLDPEDSIAWNVPYPVSPLPYPGKLAAGMYQVTAQDGRDIPEWGSKKCLLQARPRRGDWSLHMHYLGST